MNKVILLVLLGVVLVAGDRHMDKYEREGGRGKYGRDGYGGRGKYGRDGYEREGGRGKYGKDRDDGRGKSDRDGYGRKGHKGHKGRKGGHRGKDMMRSIPSDGRGFVMWCAHSWTQKLNCVDSEKSVLDAGKKIKKAFEADNTTDVKALFTTDPLLILQVEHEQEDTNAEDNAVEKTEDQGKRRHKRGDRLDRHRRKFTVVYDGANSGITSIGEDNRELRHSLKEGGYFLYDKKLSFSSTFRINSRKNWKDMSSSAEGAPEAVVAEPTNRSLGRRLLKKFGGKGKGRASKGRKGGRKGGYGGRGDWGEKKRDWGEKKRDWGNKKGDWGERDWDEMKREGKGFIIVAFPNMV